MTSGPSLLKFSTDSTPVRSSRRPPVLGLMIGVGFVALMVSGTWLTTLENRAAAVRERADLIAEINAFTPESRIGIERAERMGMEIAASLSRSFIQFTGGMEEAGIGRRAGYAAIRPDPSMPAYFEAGRQFRSRYGLGDAEVALLRSRLEVRNRDLIAQMRRDTGQDRALVPTPASSRSEFGTREVYALSELLVGAVTAMGPEWRVDPRLREMAQVWIEANSADVVAIEQVVELGLTVRFNAENNPIFARHLRLILTELTPVSSDAHRRRLMQKYGAGDDAWLTGHLTPRLPLIPAEPGDIETIFPEDRQLTGVAVVKDVQ